MRIDRRLLVWCLVLVAGVPSSAAAQRITKESNAALRRWVDAVNGHTPGEPDAAVAYVAGLTYSNRSELHPSFALFIRVLREEVVETRTPIEQNVTAFGRMTRLDPGAAIFLKRAAILHLDALALAGRFPAPRDDAPSPPPRTRARDTPQRVEVSPLLHNEWMTLLRDGEVVGTAKRDWNLPFARSLLDVLLLPATSRPTAVDCPLNSPVKCTPVTHVDRRVSADDRSFVAAWYHAVSAYLFAKGRHADAETHLQDAARVLPDDPHALFDRGTYAEVFGLPIYQTLISERTEDRSNAQAERLFRRAIEVEPSYVEARVRLARLLEERGRYDEAAAQISTAIGTNPSGVPRFYAHIVAGRVAAARGRYEEALRHYRTAAGLYGHAQSALLGASHAALMIADLPGTLTPLEQLDGSVTASSADPWWDYEFGAGRDAVPLLDALRARGRR